MIKIIFPNAGEWQYSMCAWEMPQGISYGALKSFMGVY